MTLIKNFQNRIDNEIKTLFATAENPRGLYEPVNYSMLLGGKRIRPTLCLVGCAMFNAEAVESAVLPAVGLEVFHNFTLLHDDLMDNSVMRRNQPTVHQKWGANTAILSGDAMLVQAYQLCTKAPANVLHSVLSIFSKTALEVCEGQQYDMNFEMRDNVSEVEYVEMIRLKTAVLLGGSLKIGAVIGGGDDESISRLYGFGCNAGLSFQLQDDWLDVFGNSDDFGKPIGGDIVCNKKTFLLISALNDLPDKGRKELKKWLAAKEFDREDKIAAVKNLYDEANISKKTREKMNFYYQNALERLDGIKDCGEIVSKLKEFAHGLMERAR
ncbi:MAG: polyprenyl synthetase family protein [Cytophagaceae bacterium]|jgi:geranylgeranyl diphosphate synthase type II|nr:polyprenyl synthetase family protein [Cytophagaceae bacterium]